MRGATHRLRAANVTAMATSSNDDTSGYYLALVLFSVAIPIIAGIGYWMSFQLRDQDTTQLQLGGS